MVLATRGPFGFVNLWCSGRMRTVLFITALCFGVIACGPKDRLTQLATEESPSDAATYNDTFQAMPAEKLQRYRAALPTLAFAKLDAIMKSPKTFWYDDETIVPAYQDSVGDGRVAPIGARPNSRGHTLSLPAHLFDKEHWKFPFGHTAGTDHSTNIDVVNFIHLPEGQSGRLPIVYLIELNYQ